jgi:hypothetical protein
MTTLKALPAVGFTPPFTDVMTSFDAAPATTLNGALLPDASESPLVRVAVRTTPFSTFEYVMPEIVPVLDPAVIEPDVVPPSEPVPVRSERLTPVVATTGLVLPNWSCDVTVMLNVPPTAGDAGVGALTTNLLAAAATMVTAGLVPILVSVPADPDLV